MADTKIRGRARGPYKSHGGTYDELTTKDCLNYDCPYGYKFQTFNRGQQYCDRCIEDKKNEAKANMDEWRMLNAADKKAPRTSRAEEKQKIRIMKAKAMNKLITDPNEPTT